MDSYIAMQIYNEHYMDFLSIYKMKKKDGAIIYRKIKSIANLNNKYKKWYFVTIKYSLRIYKCSCLYKSIFSLIMRWGVLPWWRAELIFWSRELDDQCHSCQMQTQITLRPNLKFVPSNKSTCKGLLGSSVLGRSSLNTLFLSVLHSAQQPMTVCECNNPIREMAALKFDRLLIHSSMRQAYK